MTDFDDVPVHITGTGRILDSVEYEVTHTTLEDGVGFVRLSLDIWELTLTMDFTVDEAEKLICQIRDEVVEAKRAELEWRTDTDPKTGVPSGGGGSDD